MKRFSHRGEEWEVRDNIIPYNGDASSSLNSRLNMGLITFYCRSNPTIEPVQGSIPIASYIRQDNGFIDPADISEEDLKEALDVIIAEQKLSI